MSLQSISATIFTKTPLYQVLTETEYNTYTAVGGSVKNLSHFTVR